MVIFEDFYLTSFCYTSAFCLSADFYLVYFYPLCITIASIHPFSIPTCRVAWGLEPSGHRVTQVHPGQVASPSQGHTETKCHTHALLRTILERPINLTCMFLDGGRKLEYPERTNAYTGRTCRLHTERPQPGVEPPHINIVDL